MVKKNLAVLLAVVSQAACSGGAGAADDVQAYSDVFNGENTGYVYGDSALGGKHWFVFNEDYSCAYKADGFADEFVSCQDHGADDTITVYFSDASKAEVADKVLSLSANEITELQMAYEILSLELAERNEELNMCEKGYRLDPYNQTPALPQSVLHRPVFRQVGPLKQDKALTF